MLIRQKSTNWYYCVFKHLPLIRPSLSPPCFALQAAHGRPLWQHFFIAHFDNFSRLFFLHLFNCGHHLGRFGFAWLKISFERLICCRTCPITIDLFRGQELTQRCCGWMFCSAIKVNVFEAEVVARFADELIYRIEVMKIIVCKKHWFAVDIQYKSVFRYGFV